MPASDKRNVYNFKYSFGNIFLKISCTNIIVLFVSGQAVCMLGSSWKCSFENISLKSILTYSFENIFVKI